MNEDNKEPGGQTKSLPDSSLKQLRDLRWSLLRLHKLLLEMERADYERGSGQLSSGELLQLVINHAQFAWLRLISALVVQIDELLSADEPITVDDFKQVMTQARQLITSPTNQVFREKYEAALQRDPDALIAHSEVTKHLSERPA